MAVISGGSSGIGYAIARALMAEEAAVCLLARNEERLRLAADSLRAEFPLGNVAGYPGDVSDHAAMQTIIERIAQEHGGIDWLINNAGIGETGRLESRSMAEMRRVMDVNYWGAVHLTRLALPHLRKSTDAAVAFVGSVAGYVGLFGYAHYVPSKFAITGLAECLRMEFADYGIRVSVVFPPDTDTPMLARELRETLPECRALSANARVVAPGLVASCLLDGMRRGKFEIYCNFESRLIRFIRNLAPALFFREVDRIARSSRTAAATSLNR